MSLRLICFKSCCKTIIFDVIYETLERIYVISKNIQRFTVISGIEKHPLGLTPKKVNQSVSDFFFRISKFLSACKVHIF